MSTSSLPGGVVLEDIEITAMAHGGEGLGRAPDGRVVFIADTVVGDVVEAEVTRAKKRWARASLTRITVPSPLRQPVSCPAAAAGAGCCDYSHIRPEAQLGLKADVLRGQLGALANRSGVLDSFDPAADLAVKELDPVRGWRTRVRLGVDGSGRAGLRRARCTEVLPGVHCSQVVEGIFDGIVGAHARRFTPGAEVVVVLDSNSERHVVETTRAQRGRRVERIDTVVEGRGSVVQRVGVYEFVFPATAFWQAHCAAPEHYTAVVEKWGATNDSRRVGWDLYGGVGVFVPAISQATGGGHVDSVDYSPTAATPQPSLDGFDVRRHNQKVEVGFDNFADPALVVLDPPRSGAGKEVIGKTAHRRPNKVVHVGCDPATFSRDLSFWGEHSYAVKAMELIDAFPGTHHFETIALLEPR
ncbi:class I SAM-dependent RNA methyltransferase [Corynebacterium mayonis]|uniref:class I SAM-dependent RNA methyltransferase n=1 Tax=Corynebacterium mayonis TaxID=3062461 RepID=UPI003140088C